MSHEEHWKRFVEHMEQKYSDAGYIKLWIHGSENEKNLITLRNIIKDKEKLRDVFEKFYADN